MFALLISVSGVGPKLAMNILSNIPTADLHAALREGNWPAFRPCRGSARKPPSA